MKLEIAVDGTDVGQHVDLQRFDSYITASLAEVFTKNLPDHFDHRTTAAPAGTMGLYSAITWVIEYHKEIASAAGSIAAIAKAVYALYKLHAVGASVTIIIEGQPIALKQHHASIDEFQKALDDALKAARK